MVTTKCLHITQIQDASVLFEFIMNLNIVVSFYHTMAMKRSLEDGEIERQLKSNCAFLDPSRSTIKRQDSVTLCGGLKHVYISSR
jgi:hypothetical protein